MKKMVILIVGLCLSMSLRADDPNLYTATQIVTFPGITVDNNAAYVNVQLLLDADGTWDILAFKEEPALNLAGTRSGDLGEIGDFGVPMCTALTEVSLIQNGKEITGTGSVTGCVAGGNGIIKGIIDGILIGNDISFVFMSENELFSYSGLVSNDHLSLNLLGPGFFNTDDRLEWKLNLQD